MKAIGKASVDVSGEDDFPDPRSLFMRLAGLIDRAEVVE